MNLNIISQIGLALFGLTGIFLTTTKKPSIAKWGPIVGLFGQAFWINYALINDAYGILVISIAYLFVWMRAIRNYWLKDAERPTAADKPKRKVPESYGFNGRLVLYVSHATGCTNPHMLKEAIEISDGKEYVAYPQNSKEADRNNAIAKRAIDYIECQRDLLS